MWNTDSDLTTLVRKDRELWEERLIRWQQVGGGEPVPPDVGEPRALGARPSREGATAGRAKAAPERAEHPGPERGLLLALLGLIAGFFSGFLGIGGGLVIVPGLMIAFRYPMKRAVGTSLASIVAVSLAGVLAEMVVKRANIHWTMALVVTIASLLGSWAGGKILARVPDMALRLGFSGFLFFAAYRMMAAAQAGGPGPVALGVESAAGYALGFTVGGLAGVTSVLFGLGGGLVMVPAFTLLFGDFPFHAARATSLVQIVPTAGLSAYQHHGMGTVDVAVARRLIPAGLGGAILGVIAVNLLPAAPCRVAFAAFLVYAALRMLMAGRCLGVMKRVGASWGRARIAAAAAALVLGTLAIAEAGAPQGRGADATAGLPWAGHVRRMDEALARKDVSAAVRAWHDGYATALGARRWEGLVEVADAYLRIGEVAGYRKESEPKARTLYLAALFRARDQRSLDGVLRATEAFAKLGDREVVDRCLTVAYRVAAQSSDPAARDRVNAFRASIEVRFVTGTVVP